MPITSDDRGFSPYYDNVTATARDAAFAETRARALGTVSAAEAIGGK